MKAAVSKIDDVFLGTAIIVIVGLVMLIGLQNQRSEPNAYINEVTIS